MKKIISILLLAVFFISCQSDNEATQVDTSFNIPNLLNDIANTQILPQVNDFDTNVKTLQTATTTFLNSVEASNLENLKNQWKATASAYAKIYPFNIGPVRDQYLNLALYNWPTNAIVIEGYIANTTELSKDFSKYSPQVKTLSALEYLLFNENISALISKYKTEANRRKYLELTINELKSQSTRLANIWAADKDNYVTTFITNSGNGIEQSFNLFFNGLHNAIDTGKVTKIGKPAGLENSKNTNYKLSQAYYSNYSLELLKNNLESVQAVYFNTKGLGLKDYVKNVAKNDELNNAVLDAFNEAYTVINSFNETFAEAITSNNTKVPLLHAKLNDLRVLFSVDLRSRLSIVITSTDNDGD